MSDPPDRSEVWLRILDSVLRSSPDLLGTNTVDDVVRMVDRFEDGHAERFNASGYKSTTFPLVGNPDKDFDPPDPAEPEVEEDPEMSVEGIVTSWAKSTDATALQDCMEDLRKAGLDDSEVQAAIDEFWPQQGAACPGCNILADPATMEMSPTHGNKFVCRSCKKLDLDTRIISTVAKWAGQDSNSSRIMCIKELRREFGLSLDDARDAMNRHWPVPF